MTVQRWLDRIQDVVKMRAGDMLIYKFNPKTHPSRQREVVTAQLDRYGKAAPLLGWHSESHNGRLVVFDGNLRVDLSDPDEEWWVCVLDYTDAEAEEHILTYDSVTTLAEIDPSAFAALTAGKTIDDEVLAGFLGELAEGAGLGEKARASGNGAGNEDGGILNICPICGNEWRRI